MPPNDSGDYSTINIQRQDCFIMIVFFIVLQCVLLFFMLFHDWISIPPFNDVAALKKADSTYKRLLGSAINGITVLIPLILTLAYFRNGDIALGANIAILVFYAILTVGTILSWWVPHFFGSSKKHKQQFRKFKNTHHFLPARKDNVVPNTLHVVLHLQVWACLALSIYFLT
jgi:hypothetical protein